MMTCVAKVRQVSFVKLIRQYSYRYRCRNVPIAVKLQKADCTITIFHRQVMHNDRVAATRGRLKSKDGEQIASGIPEVSAKQKSAAAHIQGNPKSAGDHNAGELLS